MNHSKNKAAFGKQQEYVAIAKLLELKLDVYVPIVDDKGIDCIIRRGDNDYIEIQIKARSADCNPKESGKFAGLKILEPRENYYFLFYSEKAKTYWIIPSLELVCKASKVKTGTQQGSITLT